MAVAAGERRLHKAGHYVEVASCPSGITTAARLPSIAGSPTYSGREKRAIDAGRNASLLSYMAKIPLKLERLIDGVALRHDHTALTAATGGNGAPPAVRSEVLKLLKATIASGRGAAEAMLTEDGSGTACASRLSHLMDEIIR